MRMRGEAWPPWAVGLVFGGIVGLPIASFGLPMLVLSVALVALAFMVARNLAFLSGAVTGIGGIWLALLARAELACEAYDAAPNQGCESSGVEPFAMLGVVVVAVGVLIGLLAWRRRAAQRRAAISMSSPPGIGP
jgi:hypothetical protein